MLSAHKSVGACMVVKLQDRRHALEGGKGLAGHVLRREWGRAAKRAQGKAQCRGGLPQWRDRGGALVEWTLVGRW